ncbi:hypothetical protein HY500_04365 [Candidatus Woesearchaeota archaeon]|nr:hypothetical protein [Candidatus Woesearchaeota archaeon]
MNKWARRCSYGLASLVLAGGVAALSKGYGSREAALGNTSHPMDGVLLSVAYKDDLAPYSPGDDAIYNLGAERIVVRDLSEVVYFMIAIDGDGIRNAFLFFDGVEVRSAIPRDHGNGNSIKTYGGLPRDIKRDVGDEYELRLSVIDNHGEITSYTATIELRLRSRSI